MSGNPNVSLLDANYSSTTPRVIDWTANTQYAAQQVVLYSGTLYRAKTQFTSGSSFTVSNWDLVDSGSYPQWYICSGLDTTGASDVSAAIQAKIDAAGAAGGGIVYIPEGSYKLTTALVPKQGVSITGAGRSKTILLPYGGAPAIKDITTFSTGTPLTNCTYSAFAIDGSNQTGTDTGIKGIFILYLQRCTFRDLYIHDCIATGLGVDYLSNVTVDNVTANSNGRGNDGTGSGGAGIGIGTGAFTTENFTIVNCTAKNNKRNGIFVELESGGTSVLGAKIIGCYAEGNENGFQDAGMTGCQWIGCVGYANTKCGWTAASGTVSPGFPGKRGAVIGGSFESNTLYGIHYDASAFTTSDSGGYTIQGATASLNGIDGIRITTAASGTKKLRDMVIVGSRGKLNGECGLRLTGTVGITELLAESNNFLNNGTNVAGSKRDGIHVGVNLSNSRIEHNLARDNQALLTQQYGISVLSGAVLFSAVIANNDVETNAAGTIDQQGTVSGKTEIRDNVGYNPVGTSTVTPGASPWTYTFGPAGGVLYLENATAISNITKGGQTIYNGSGATAQVAGKPNQTVAITYTGALAAKIDAW